MTAPLIAIIGAGPCGLTLARLLECMGINYIVYEREESPNSNLTGGSLDIHGDTGQLALRECGLFDKFTQMARYADTVFTITDKGGEGFLEIGQGRDAPEIDRTALRQILLDSVPGDKIMWGHALKSVTAGNDNRPLLRFANESVQSGFELVVGADGAWSKVRSTVCDKVDFLEDRPKVLISKCRLHKLHPGTRGKASLCRPSAVQIPYMRQ